jgi:hypothetical protein
MYDRNLADSNKIYNGIKLGVYKELHCQKGIKFPVIHPLIDGNRGISRLRNIESRIPFVNIFATFNAKLPILRLDDLQRELSEMGESTPDRYDIYSEYIYIKDIFYSASRFNIMFISKFIYWLVKIVNSVYPFRLLISGRKING